MFNPKYQISAKILANIKSIATLIYDLNNRNFSKVVLMDLIQRAHEISAHASTSIEGNPLPLTDVKTLLKSNPKHIRDSEREVLNYNKALTWLDSFAKKKDVQFDLSLILDIHKFVVKDLMSDSRCGKIRKEPVFVNDPLIRKTIYWPPDHQDVNALMKDLFVFLDKNKGYTDPLILAGIFHKQFVVVHPFVDGNGRTVRLTTKILLRAMGLNIFNLFSFENYYNQNVSKYFEKVGVKGNYYDICDQIDFTSWLEYFTDGIIDELLRVSKILAKKSITPKTILKEHHKQILDYIEKNDFITDKIYSTLTQRAKPTRNQDFNHLIDLGLIEMVGKGKATIYRLK
ncbi:MAG: Fic family protein [Candidatus Peregrinibacteria bacterium]|nr:Fic family protein [Candidatus Peregrinibacteria bacterium]MDZ4244514.1 Fic family protein [Candidatus Gracilibacteria bacterium]